MYRLKGATSDNFVIKGEGSVTDMDLKSRRVTGYFASFNNKDSDGDIFVPGAFSRTIKERGPGGAKKIFHLLQHNIYNPLGKPDVLREDSKGLYFETEIPNTVIGSDTLKLYEAGVYNEHSVGFVTLARETEDEGTDDEVTKLLEVMLYEGSTVTWGANDQTPFVGFKQRQGKDYLEKRMNTLIKALRDGTFSDEAFSLLEVEVQQVKSLIAEQSSGDEHPSEKSEHTFDAAGILRENLSIIN